MGNGRGWSATTHLAQHDETAGQVGVGAERDVSERTDRVRRSVWQTVGELDPIGMPAVGAMEDRLTFGEIHIIEWLMSADPRTGRAGDRRTGEEVLCALLPLLE